MSAQLATLGRRLLPAPVYSLMRAVYHRLRTLWRSARRRIEKKWRRADLVRDLRAGGVAAGDTVMVHSALSRLGS